MPRSLPATIALAFVGATAIAQAPTYVPTRVTPSATSRWVWDSVRARVVAIDGVAPVWDWDGSRWEPRLGVAPVNLGSGLSRPVYDPHRRVVMAGAHDWTGARWVANGCTWPPSSSWFGVAAFDTARRRLVVPANGSVFEWDGAVWNTLPAPNGPAMSGAFAYDPANQRCVLYVGGNTTAPAAQGWSWNGAAWTLFANPAAPGPRAGHALAFDPITSRLVLYGGGSNTTTWTLAGTTFTPVATTRDPGERNLPQFVFDGQGLLLGGGSTTRGGELWRFSNNDWNELPGGSPAPRLQAGFAWDPVRGEAVVHGGFWGQPQQGGPLGDTWTFDGQWHQHHGAGPVPNASPILVWSAVDNAVLLGNSGGTWLWNGSIWTQRQPATSPPGRWGGAFAPDPTGGVLLFGGEDLSTFTFLADTWRWNGTTWTQLAPGPAPSPRIAQMAHDPVRNRVVVAGGYAGTNFQDTWEWNGTTWTLAGTMPFLFGQPGERLTFNPATGRIRAEVYGQYEWDGAVWTTVALATQPPSYASYAADLARGRLLRCSQQDGGIAVLTPTPATSERYGNGCAIGAAPGLTTIGRPVPGAAQFALAAATNAPGAPALLALGLTAQNQPLGSGCSALVGTVLGVSLLIAAPSGQATYGLPIPAALDLRGVSFTAQIAVVDAAHGLYSGLALSDGLRTTIGD